MEINISCFNCFKSSPEPPPGEARQQPGSAPKPIISSEQGTAATSMETPPPATDQPVLEDIKLVINSEVLNGLIDITADIPKPDQTSEHNLATSITEQLPIVEKIEKKLHAELGNSKTNTELPKK